MIALHSVTNLECVCVFVYCLFGFAFALYRMVRIVLSLTNLSECGSWDFVSVLVKAFFFCGVFVWKVWKLVESCLNCFCFGFWLRNLRKVKLYFRGGN